ncbi:uncharacterized protein LOC130656484 [Hydractinia symbiolongicarpus]|uniref:uncharacterized protein LOC130656484 n=1 Tax=Hydractinia symbiolongicarpus TaxID=13093 RepID=UPI00254FFD46|nr:uncharacterized protein LOC130656484 [Hydractinia symbiolongicarpus]
MPRNDKYRKKQDVAANHVPQNFIPGLTKPRLSIHPDDDVTPATNQKVSSVCYQGVKVRMFENPKLSEKLLMRAGIVALGFPAPSKHINCEQVKKASLRSCHSFDEYDNNNHIPLERRSTIACANQTSTEHSQYSPVKNLLTRQRSVTADPVANNSLPHEDTGVEYSLNNLSNEISSSLPELNYLPEEDGSIGIQIPTTEKRRSRSFSSGLNYPPEVITQNVKRKLSRIIIKKSEEEEKQKLKQEREMLDALQGALRSKLPKTFRATASMGLFDPTCFYDSKQKHSVQQKPKLRHGSLPAIFKHVYRKYDYVVSEDEESPTDANPKRGFLKRITNSPILSRKTVSSDESGFPRSPVIEIKPSLFKRAKAYSTKNGTECLQNRNSNSSDDSGILIRSIEEDNKKELSQADVTMDCAKETQKESVDEEVCTQANTPLRYKITETEQQTNGPHQQNIVAIDTQVLRLPRHDVTTENNGQTETFLDANIVSSKTCAKKTLEKGGKTEGLLKTQLGIGNKNNQEPPLNDSEVYFNGIKILNVNSLKTSKVGTLPDNSDDVENMSEISIQKNNTDKNDEQVEQIVLREDQDTHLHVEKHDKHYKMRPKLPVFSTALAQDTTPGVNKGNFMKSAERERIALSKQSSEDLKERHLKEIDEMFNMHEQIHDKPVFYSFPLGLKDSNV